MGGKSNCTFYYLIRPHHVSHNTPQRLDCFLGTFFRQKCLIELTEIKLNIMQRATDNDGKDRCSLIKTDTGFN